MELLRSFLIVLVFVLAHSIYPADNHLPHSEVEGDPSTIVAGHVNVITGSFSDSTLDFVVAGAQPLTFNRYYSSADWRGGSLCDSWNHSYPYSCSLENNLSQYWVRPPESSGCTPGCLGRGSLNLDRKKQKVRPPAVIDTFIPFDEPGITNCGSGTIGGRTTIRNNVATWDPAKLHLSVRHGDGSERLFVSRKSDPKDTPVELLLSSEKLANGNSIHYEYDKDKLSKVVARDSLGQQLGWIAYAYEGKHRQIVTTSDGRTATFDHRQYHNKETNDKFDRYHLEKSETPHACPVVYQYTSHKADFSAPRVNPEKLSRKMAVGGQYLDITYYGYGYNQVGDVAVEVKPHKHEHMVTRVAKLEAPLGPNGEKIITHRFFYSVPLGPVLAQQFPGSTTVLDALNHQTIYHYNWFHRPTRIEYFTGDKNYQKHCHECFYWGAAGSNIYGNGTDLVCKALCEANGDVRSCRHLQYDSHHNVVCEQLCGNLSGHGNSPILDVNGSVTNDCERYERIYTYSSDGFNLLKSEMDGVTGRLVTYEYKKGTDLLLSKLTHDKQGKIILREFFDYDSAAVMIESISDDGSSPAKDDLTDTTLRLVRKITPKGDEPCKGLPQAVEEFGVHIPSQMRLPLRGHLNFYSSEGWLQEQHHYDAYGNFAYALHWCHDRFGNVVEESDALGQLTHRRYDERSNKIYECKEGTGVEFHYTYDLANRLTSTREHHADGTCLTTFNRYDSLSQLVEHQNEFGQVTKFSYDEFGNQTEVQLPDGSINRFAYDVAGNCVKSWDALGNVTETTYNIRSQPVTITHPDSTQEAFTYYLDGTVASHKSKNGVLTQYTYDELGQVTSKKCFDQNGSLLCQTSATYKGRLLMAETDANGNITYYEYDPFGRKLKESRDHHLVYYRYDALGRQNQLLTCVNIEEDEGSASCKEYDLCGQVLREWIEDDYRNVLLDKSFTYDAAGRCISSTQMTQQGPATTHTKYDPRGHVIEIIDPMGAVTKCTYNYSWVNADGHRVLQTVQQDPLMQWTITTYDILGRVRSVELKSPSDQTLAKYALSYDACNRLTLRIDSVYVAGLEVRQVATCWEYNPTGQIAKLIEAAGATEERTTEYKYNVFGQLESVKMPDSVKLIYSYDGMGRVDTYASSDSSFHYRYGYDQNGNVIVVHNQEGESTLRAYDSSNRMIEETLENGLKLKYAYDGLGRLLRLQLPDNSSIAYRYDACHLRAVERVDPSGSCRYRHVYEEFDLANHLTRATLANGASVNYDWDLNLRPVAVTSKSYSETIQQYDAVGNLRERLTKDLLGNLPHSYTYNDQYQLASETGETPHRYTHDSLFNRLLQDDASYAVNALNQLITKGQTRYIYDKRGNLMSAADNAGELCYYHDGLNRLIAVEGSDWRVTYTYDAFNRRLAKTFQGADGSTATQRFLYSGDNEIGSVNEDGSLAELRVLGTGLGAEIGAAVAVELGGQLYIPQHDLNGNVVALLNGQGDVEEVYRYSAFGEERLYATSGERLEQSGIGMPWRFSSKRVDPETGWVYFGRRHYAPALGRWMTPDPIGYKGGPNLYAYVSNNPLTHIDLYGLIEQGGQGKLERRSESDHSYKQRSSWRRQGLDLIRMPGRLAEKVVHYLAPPFARDLLKPICRAASFRPLGGCEYCRDYPSYRYTVDGPEIPNVRSVAMNGQGNMSYEGEEWGQNIASTHGYKTHGGYNGGIGLLCDTIHSCTMKVGAYKDSIHMLKDELMYQHQQIKNMPNPTIRLSVFSQGSEIAYRASLYLPREVRQCIDYHAWGPSTLIPRGWFRSVDNVVATNDYVSRAACGLDCIKGFRRGDADVRWIQGNGFVSHPWASTYAEDIKKTGLDFQHDYLGK